ncbi:MAG: hypothetical protein ACRCST_06960 [Turicibacter sp.]
MSVISFKCPNCGALIHYDPKRSQCLCEHCSSCFSIDEMNGFISKQVKDDQVSSSTSQTAKADPVVYHCPSCGALLITTQTSQALICAYCQSPIVLTHQLADHYKPKHIIPFLLSQDEAKEKLLAFTKNKYFIPKDFTSPHQIENLTGIYVPYWLFNCLAQGEIKAEATTIETWSDHEYNYTKTNHYHIERVGEMTFNNVAHNASNKIPSQLIESIEPFDYTDLKDFSMSYLAGFYADQFDSSSEDVYPTILKRIEEVVSTTLKQDASQYSSILIQNSSTQLSQTEYAYTLMPIYLMTYEQVNKSYQFIINGQTGKVFGTLPLSKIKLTVGALALFSSLFIAMFLGGVSL